MFRRVRPRLGVTLGFVGGLLAATRIHVVVLDRTPFWFWAVVGLALLGSGLAYAWPRPGDTERLMREAEERAIRKRARVPSSEPESKGRPGRTSATSRRFLEDGPAWAGPTGESEAMRRELRELQRQMQEAAVRLGLNQISKEGYTAQMEELRQKRSALETEIMRIERRPTAPR